MPDKSADAGITDPPYNVGLNYDGYDDKRAYEEYRDWCIQWFFELRRVVRGPIAISCGHSNLAMWAGIRKWDWCMAWHKPGAMSRCKMGFCQWEPIPVWGKVPIVHTDHFLATLKVNKVLKGNHPCPKPIEWAIEQLTRLTKPGATVIDPFCGSGTVGIACVMMGRKFIGIEQSEQYIEFARQRILGVEVAA